VEINSATYHVVINAFIGGSTGDSTLPPIHEVGIRYETQALLCNLRLATFENKPLTLSLLTEDRKRNSRILKQ